MGGVRAKIGLTGQLDRRQPGNYFKPCTDGEIIGLLYSDIGGGGGIYLENTHGSCKKDFSLGESLPSLTLDTL